MTVITDEESYQFQIGDIVTEKPYIIPPDRARWTGVVVAVDKDKFMNHTFSGIFEEGFNLIKFIKEKSGNKRYIT